MNDFEKPVDTTINDFKQYLKTISDPEIKRLLWAFFVVGLCVKSGMSKEEILKELERNEE